MTTTSQMGAPDGEDALVAVAPLPLAARTAWMELQGLCVLCHAEESERLAVVHGMPP